MAHLQICIDCGRTVDAVKRGRCALCWPAVAKRQKKREPNRSESSLRKRAAYQSITKTNRWKKLSQQVRLRDGACTSCGRTDDLTVHHIAPVAAAPDLAFDWNNLITLCRACHSREERRAA